MQTILPSGVAMGRSLGPDVEALLDAAEARATEGDLGRAIVALEDALDRAPGTPGILALLAPALYQAGRWTEACHRFRQLLEARPADTRVHVQLALACLQAGRVEEFEAAMGLALEREPDNEDALRLLARVAFEKQRFAEAGAFHGRLVAAGKADATTYLSLGACLARGGQWEIAAETFARVLLMDPSAPFARENLDVARSRLGWPATTGSDPHPLLAEAEAHRRADRPALRCLALRDAVDRDGSDPGLQLSLVTALLDHGWTDLAGARLEGLAPRFPSDPRIWTALAMARCNAQDLAGARRALAHVLVIDPTSRDGRRLEADLTAREGRPAEALPLYTRLLGRDPDDPSLWLARGTCAYHVGAYADAVADFESTLRLAPDDARARENLAAAQERLRRHEATEAADSLARLLAEADALNQAGRLPEAISRLEDATRLRPDSAEVWDALGSLRFAAGDAEGSRLALSEAVRRSPGQDDMEVRLAMAQQASGRPGEARDVLDGILARTPDHPPALRLLGDLLLEEDPQRAREAYARRLARMPGLLDDLIRLGLAGRQAGRRDEARAVFQAVLAIDPSHPLARRAMERTSE